MDDIIGGLIGVALLILWIYCIYDVIVTDDAIIRHLPKLVWLMIVFFIPDIGSFLWLGLGRPQIWTRRAHDPAHYGTRPHGRPPGELASPRVLDDPALDTLSPIVRHREEQARLRMWEAQLQRREEELRRRLAEGSDAES